MRKLALLLVLLVAVSFADVLFDQAYTGTADNAYGYHNGYHLADEFAIGNPSRLESIEWWGIFSMDVGTFDIQLLDDDSGLPGTVVWEVLGATATTTDTGDDYNGYDINNIEVVLDSADYFEPTPGTTYWLSIYQNGQGAFWCFINGGTAAGNNGGPWATINCTLLLRLNGTDNYSSIEETTWEQIKAAL